MIIWVIEHINITNEYFMPKRNMVIDSFTGKYLSLMYHLGPPQKKYKKEFLEKFMKENED